MKSCRNQQSSNGVIRKSFNLGKGEGVRKSTKIPRLPTSSKINLKITMNATNNNEVTDEELRSWHDWVGHRVSISGVKVGTLRFFGRTHFAEGCWCGIELDEPVGKNNGVVKDVQYFTCGENFGIFAPLSKTKKILDIDCKNDFVSKSKLSDTYNKYRYSKNDMPEQEEDKLHFPYSNSNINERKINSSSPNINEKKLNTISEKSQRLRRKSDVFLEQTRTDFNMNQNQFNNVNEVNNAFNFNSLEITERKTSTPVASPVRNNSIEQILNQTITIDRSNKASVQNAPIDYLPKTCLLNVTFGLPDTHAKSCVNLDKRESTFVTESSNILRKDFSKAPLVRNSTEEDNTSTELEESSLGILSLSQMKDFTLSFGSDSTVTTVKKTSEIRKMESCDDVNEIPEFEENAIDVENISEKSQNSVIDFNETCETRKINSIDELNKTTVMDNTVRQHSSFKDTSEGTIASKNFNNCQSSEQVEMKKFKSSLNSSSLSCVDDINLNVLPTATSTPTLTGFEAVKFALPANSSIVTSSDSQSPHLGCTVSSAAFNRTYNLLPNGANSSTPKLNVISKLLHDLDHTFEKVSDIEDYVFQSDFLKHELISNADRVPNNLSHKFDSFNASDNVPNLALNISSAVNDESILLKTALIPDFSLDKSRNHESDFSNSNDINDSQGNKTSVSTSTCRTEICNDNIPAVNLNHSPSLQLNINNLNESNVALSNTQTIYSNDSEYLNRNCKDEVLLETYTCEETKQLNSQSMSSHPSSKNNDVKASISRTLDKTICLESNVDIIQEHVCTENNSDETNPSDATTSIVDDSETDINVTFSADSSICSYQQSEIVTDDKNTEPVFSKLATAEQNQSLKVNNLKSAPKQPKKNVVSKIKLMLESNKNNSVANRENITSKNKLQSHKTTGKWSAVTSKLASTLNDNKQKIKNEVSSRINTNLKSLPLSAQKASLQLINKTAESRKIEAPVRTTPARTLNAQKAKTKSTSSGTSENDSRVLTQLQNVVCANKINESRGPKSKAMTIDTATSLGNKEKELVEKDPKSKTMTIDAATSLGNKEKELAGKSGIPKFLRRNNTLPKVKQYSRSLFQRK